MQHLEEGTIHAWLDGALDASESARVEHHVTECASCSAAVAEARGMIAGASSVVSSLDLVKGNVIPRQSGKIAPRGWLWRSLRLSPGRAAVAAGLLLATASVLTVRHAPSNGPSTAPDVGVAATAPAPKPPASPALSPPPSNAPSATPPTVVASSAASPEPQRPIAPAEKTVAVAAAAVRDSAMTVDSMAKRSVASAVQPAPVINRPGAATAPNASNASSASSATAVAAAQAADVRGVAPSRFTQNLGLSGAPASLNPAGCYQLDSDSVVAQSNLDRVPTRFALQQTSGQPPQNIVRAVSPQGRIDSVIAGTRWERVTPTMTRVYLNSRRAESSSTLTLHFADGVVAGQLATPSGTKNLVLSRAVCRP